MPWTSTRSLLPGVPSWMTPAPVPSCPTCAASAIQPREKEAYADSAMARDVLALIEHLRLDVRARTTPALP
jgi:hypothetical protein